MTPRNPHLSYSRLSRFETCPLSYRLHYLDGAKAEPGVALRFGKVIHAVLERLVRDVVEKGIASTVCRQQALDFYREAWIAEGLTGAELFGEGLAILEDFIRDQGLVRPEDVLAVEKEFRLGIGPFTLLGYLDRVDRVDGETVEVIDYKTSRQLFSRDEVATSLQLSLYHAAAQQLWPWAKKVRLSFWMLRHRVRQETERTPEQAQAALDYALTLGQQCETAVEFPARLGPGCPFCDHRRNCSAYEEALGGEPRLVCEDLGDLEAVAQERERACRLIKVLSARKDELEAVLKARLRHEDELLLGGVRYRMFRTTRSDYPLLKTVETLSRATGRSQLELLQELGAIDNRALSGLLKKLGQELPSARVELLKTELEAGAHQTFSARFWAKEVRP